MIKTLPCKCEEVQELISLKEAAEIVGMHEKSIKYWVDTKPIFREICTQDTTGRKQWYVDKEKFLNLRETTKNFKEKF